MKKGTNKSLWKLISGKDFFKSLWILVFTVIPWGAAQLWDYKHQVDENKHEIIALREEVLVLKANMKGTKELSISNGTLLQVHSQRLDSARRDIDRLYEVHRERGENDYVKNH